MPCVGSWTFMPLTGGAKGGYTLIDAEDYEWAKESSWRLLLKPWTNYVQGSPSRRMLHREVMGLEHGDGKYVDHLNHNGLDNRKCNLRVVTNSQNLQNRSGAARGSRSQYRNVFFKKGKPTKPWFSIVTVDKVRHWLGYFETEEEAAQVAADFRKNNMPFSAADQEG